MVDHLHLSHPQLYNLPPVQPPAPPTQPVVPPAQTIAPPTHSIHPASMPQLNWSHFKPEFTGKPDEDAEEAHLLRTNDWMDTHFPRRCQSLVFLSNISRRSKVTVQIIKAYNCRLEQVTKSVLTAILQDRQY